MSQGSGTTGGLAGSARFRSSVQLMIATSDLGHVPPNVQVESWVPQAEVLPYVDLVVSHGGSGTVLGAIANGLPQLMLPQGADQFSNAGAVTAAGAGRQILPGQLTATEIAEQADALLHDRGAFAAAAAVAAEIADMPPPADVVNRLAVPARQA